jgi:signal transduction histidine kinase
MPSTIRPRGRLVTIVSLFTQLLVAFGTPHRRAEAIRRLAALIGADSVTLFARDVDSRALVPITPFDPRSSGENHWREAAEAARIGTPSAAMLPHPVTGASVRVQLQQADDGSVFAAVGGQPRPMRLQLAVRTLPLIVKILRADRVEVLAAQARRAEARAAEASRLKDEFLATLSHELRTPLNAMIGWIQMLRLHRDDEGLRERALEVIERNARAQAQIVADLLDVSRIITGKLRLRFSRVDLVDVVRAGCESLRPSIEARNLHLTIERTSMPCIVNGDADRLQQVVWNLVSNAAKFTAPGGRVDVRLGANDSTAWISVSDTGVGIHPEFVPYVFDRFRQEDSTLTRSYGGLGLGLALVRHLIELHGGSVEAASEGEHRGATFTVRLPCTRPGESYEHSRVRTRRTDIG